MHTCALQVAALGVRQVVALRDLALLPELERSAALLRLRGVALELQVSCRRDTRCWALRNGLRVTYSKDNRLFLTQRNGMQPGVSRKEAREVDFRSRV